MSRSDTALIKSINQTIKKPLCQEAHFNQMLPSKALTKLIQAFSTVDPFVMCLDQISNIIIFECFAIATVRQRVDALYIPGAQVPEVHPIHIPVRTSASRQPLQGGPIVQLEKSTHLPAASSRQSQDTSDVAKAELKALRGSTTANQSIVLL